MRPCRFRPLPQCPCWLVCVGPVVPMALLVKASIKPRVLSSAHCGGMRTASQYGKLFFRRELRGLAQEDLGKSAWSTCCARWFWGEFFLCLLLFWFLVSLAADSWYKPPGLDHLALASSLWVLSKSVPSAKEGCALWAGGNVLLPKPPPESCPQNLWLLGKNFLN